LSAAPADKKGRRVGKDKKGAKGKTVQQDFLYGGFDVVTNRSPVPVMLEIVVNQKTRRLGKKKRKGKKKIRRLDEDAEEEAEKDKDTDVNSNGR